MYFNNFPKILYNGVSARNIMLKSALVAEVFQDTNAFFPYIVKEGSRPDLVSTDVYGTPYLDWLIYFCNRVVDPYYEWPLEQSDFKSYVEKKYSATVYELMNTTSHYEYTGLTNESVEDVKRKSWKMTTTTHAKMVVYGEDTSGWSAVSLYDYEDRLNESRRSILLLSDRYVSQVTAEIARVLNK